MQVLKSTYIQILTNTSSEIIPPIKEEIIISSNLQMIRVKKVFVMVLRADATNIILCYHYIVVHLSFIYYFDVINKIY